MMDKNLNLLGKDVTITKVDGSHVRAYCQNQTIDGLYIVIDRRVIFIPYVQISEAFYVPFKPIPIGKFPELQVTEDGDE
jgi:hypothetical protein